MRHLILIALCSSVVALPVPAVRAAVPGPLRWGTSPGNPPFEFKRPDGRLDGFNIALGNAICAKLRVRCEWVENDFDGMIPALMAKKFDIINASMSITAIRARQVAFSDRVSKTPDRMLARSGEALLPDPGSLARKRVGVQQGSTHAAFARHELAQHGVEVVSYGRSDQLFADLANGRLDVAILDSVEASKNFLSKRDGRGFALTGSALTDPRYFGHGTGMGLRKADTALLQSVNMALAALKADGTYAYLAERYVGFDISGD